MVNGRFRVKFKVGGLIEWRFWSSFSSKWMRETFHPHFGRKNKIFTEIESISSRKKLAIFSRLDFDEKTMKILKSKLAIKVVKRLQNTFILQAALKYENTNEKWNKINNNRSNLNFTILDNFSNENIFSCLF